MKFQGFIGPSYTLKSINVDCQRCVNLYPEIDELGTGKGAEVMALRSTPGLEKILELGEGPIRLIHIDKPPRNEENPTIRIFVVRSEKVYKVSYEAGVWSSDELGELETETGRVSAASASFDLGVVVFVDGARNYIYHKYETDLGPVEEFGLFSSQGYPEAPNATHVIFVDGFFVFNSAGTGQFYVSNWNTIEVDPLNFASAEGDPDNIVAIIANARDIYLLNERTTEVFGNTGNADFPFERVSGGFIEKGCVAPFSVAKIDGFICWLGRDEFGQGIVYAASGLTPQRISTHAVETAIQSYADISKATGYTYQSGGHAFYVLNFDEATWVYDSSTKMWHERAYTNEGDLERHRAECHGFLPDLGVHILGDYENGNLYIFNDDVYTDDGDAITRMRVTPHISNSLNRVFFKELRLDMETGVGLDGSGLGSDPQVVLTYSNDGGHTWSDEAYASAGKKVGGIGDYKKRVKWSRLGSARDRVFKIVITDPVKVTLIGAEIDVEAGVS